MFSKLAANALLFRAVSRASTIWFRSSWCIRPTNPVFWMGPMIASFAIKNMDKKEKMFAMVEQWRGSGLTRKAFALQHGMSEASFKYWCKRQFNEVAKANLLPAGCT
jgi:hypothetical protein